VNPMFLDFQEFITMQFPGSIGSLRPILRRLTKSIEIRSLERWRCYGVAIHSLFNWVCEIVLYKRWPFIEGGA
jgi:hypothetical protein